MMGYDPFSLRLKSEEVIYESKNPKRYWVQIPSANDPTGWGLKAIFKLEHEAIFECEYLRGVYGQSRVVLRQYEEVTNE